MIARHCLMIACSALALAGCSEPKVESEAADSVSVSIGETEADAGPSATSLAIAGDSEAGKVEIKLPGGLEARVKLPGGVNDADFDIDGVGLYPGAKVGAIAVNASEAAGGKRAEVEIGFSAPADAAAVADWYQQQFEAKKIAVTRSGETLSGTTEDGENFVLALRQKGTGAASGTLKIIDLG